MDLVGDTADAVWKLLGVGNDAQSRIITIELSPTILGDQEMSPCWEESHNYLHRYSHIDNQRQQVLVS